MPCRAVLFDLDGTLLDTIADLSDAMNLALIGNGLPPRPEVEQHKYFVGDGVANYVLRAMPADRTADARLVSAVTADYRAAYAKGWHRKTRPYGGVIELLDELARRGVRLAVLSNKPQDTTTATVEAFFGPGRFEIVQGARDGVSLKPDPAAALDIARRMGVPPEQLLYLGDTATDMRTAAGAGMKAVGCLWGFRTRAELVGSGAAAVIEHPADLLRFL